MDNTIEVDNPKVIFIGGTGRCGTNISKALLTNHPQVVSLPFEYRFIIDPDGIVDFYRSYTATWSPYLADRRLKRLEGLLDTVAEEPTLHRVVGNLIRFINWGGKILTPRRYHGWNLEHHLPGFKQYTRNLMAELREFSFPARWVGTESYVFQPHLYFAGPKSKDDLAGILGNFVKQVIGRFLIEQGKAFYVEDNTWNILFARELIELIPTAKILHIYRDPRDVVASFAQQRWCPSDTKQAALWYKSMIDHWFTVKANLPLDSYYEYSLESLVNSTEQIVQEICHFTGIPYRHVLLETDLSKSHSGRWKQHFTLSEQRMLQDILGDVITTLGYE